MQKISIIGNLGQDLKSTSTESGNVLYEISVGCTQGKDDSKITTWYRCSSMYINEGLRSYLLKGKKVLVHGQLKISQYTNASGVTGINANIYVDYIQLVGGDIQNNSIPAQTTNQQNLKPASNAPISQTKNDDDLPF